MSALAFLGIRAAKQVRSAFALWAWGAKAARAAVDAEFLHAHDLSGGVPALFVADTSRATLVYDSHEVFLESGHWARAPRFVRRLLASKIEQPLLRRAAGLITVNPSVEQVLSERYEIPDRRAVVYNCVDPLVSPVRPRELRDAIGLTDDTPIALYHGGFSPVRGLRQIIDAAVDPRLENIHVAFLGYGPMEAELRTLAARPDVAGRIHVLKAVSPEVLDRWVAGADVGLMPNQHETLDGPEGPLGALCNPSDPADIARAIVEVIGGTPAEREAYRSRCRAAALARWNWDAQVATLVQLYGDLDPA